MRNAILAMTMALTLVKGQLRAATEKTPPVDVGPGHDSPPDQPHHARLRSMTCAAARPPATCLTHS